MKEKIEQIIKDIATEMPVSCVDEEGMKEIDQCFRDILNKHLL